MAEDGLFSASILEIRDNAGNLVLTFAVNKEIDGYVPIRISVRRAGGRTDFATVQGDRKGKRETLRLVRGKPFEFGKVKLDPLTDMTAYTERAIMPGEPIVVSDELKRLEEFLKLNEDDISKAVDSVRGEMVELVPELAAKMALPPETPPRDVLAKVAEAHKIAVEPKDTVDDIATKFAREYLDSKVSRMRELIAGGRSLEESLNYISELERAAKEHREPAIVAPLRVGDRVRIRTGLDPSTEFKGVSVGGLADRGGTVVTVSQVISPGVYRVVDDTGSVWGLTDEMVDTVMPPVPATPTPAAVPTTTVPVSPTGIEPKPPLSALTPEQRNTWNMIVGTVQNMGVVPGDIISIDYLENKTTRNAYYFVVVYEVSGKYFAGPIYGGYGSAPNTKGIVSYSTLQAAEVFASGKIRDKLAGQYVAVARYERPPAGRTPPAPPRVATPGVKYFRLVIYGKTFPIKDEIKQKFDEYKSRYGGMSMSRSVQIPGRKRPTFMWQLIGTHKPGLDAISQWATGKTAPHAPVYTIIEEVHGPRQFYTAPPGRGTGVLASISNAISAVLGGR